MQLWLLPLDCCFSLGKVPPYIPAWPPFETVQKLHAFMAFYRVFCCTATRKKEERGEVCFFPPVFLTIEWLILLIQMLLLCLVCYKGQTVLCLKLSWAHGLWQIFRKTEVYRWYRPVCLGSVSQAFWISESHKSNCLLNKSFTLLDMLISVFVGLLSSEWFIIQISEKNKKDSVLS